MASRGQWLPTFVLEQQSPTFWAPGTGFLEDYFSTDNRGGMTQAPYIYYAFSSYYYYIPSTSDR